MNKYQKGFISIALGVYIFMGAFIGTAIVSDEIGDRQAVTQAE